MVFDKKKEAEKKEKKLEGISGKTKERYLAAAKALEKSQTGSSEDQKKALQEFQAAVNAASADGVTDLKYFELDLLEFDEDGNASKDIIFGSKSPTYTIRLFMEEFENEGISNRRIMSCQAVIAVFSMGIFILDDRFRMKHYPMRRSGKVALCDKVVLEKLTNVIHGYGVDHYFLRVVDRGGANTFQARADAAMRKSAESLREDPLIKKLREGASTAGI